MDLGARAGVLGACLVLCLGGCAQTDVVATEAPLCVHDGGCMTDGACSARVCEPPASTASSALYGRGVQVGDSCGDSDPTQQAFRFALCTCSDFVSEAPLIVEATSGSPAASAPVGINGSLNLGAGGHIDGALQVAGMISGDAEAQVAGALLEHANASCNCSADNLLDVPALVAARAQDNDDAAQGLDPNVVDGFSGAQRLALDTGTLYLSRIAGDDTLTLAVQGAVSLFVGAEIALDRGFSLELASGATLDLFVASTVRVGGPLALGQEGDAPRVRLYVGGHGTIDLSDQARIAGFLYAPDAELVTRGPLELYGPLFVRRAAPGGELRIHYDPAYATPAACGE